MPCPAAAWGSNGFPLDLTHDVFSTPLLQTIGALFELRPHLRSVGRAGGTDYRMDSRFKEVYDPARICVLVQCMMRNTIEVLDIFVAFEG